MLRVTIMSSDECSDAEVEEAQKAAVKLLKEMADDLPLRSDTKKRRAKIAEIEECLDDDR